jgi:hypothetical protein
MLLVVEQEGAGARSVTGSLIVKDTEGRIPTRVWSDGRSNEADRNRICTKRSRSGGAFISKQRNPDGKQTMRGEG